MSKAKKMNKEPDLIAAGFHKLDPLAVRLWRIEGVISIGTLLLVALVGGSRRRSGSLRGGPSRQDRAAAEITGNRGPYSAASVLSTPRRI